MALNMKFTREETLGDIWVKDVVWDERISSELDFVSVQKSL